MASQASYVLLLAPHTEELHGLEALLAQMHCTVKIAHSADQAIANVSQEPPYLVILQENLWVEAFINQMRSLADGDRMTLVVITERHSPSWLYQEQNPGIDGFLVKPLSQDILFSLIHSASARQHCLSS